MVVQLESRIPYTVLVEPRIKGLVPIPQWLQQDLIMAQMLGGIAAFEGSNSFPSPKYYPLETIVQ